MIVLCLCTGSFLSEVQAKNKGYVRSPMANNYRRAQNQKMFVLHNEDHIFNRWCAVVDYWFDWMGWHTIPQTIRYSIVLFFMVAPFQALFFYCCCIHNDEYDDPEDERLFKIRANKWEQRRLNRLQRVKE